MGWNSYTCYWIAVREQEVKANAGYMGKHLVQHGWQYVVIDGMWYQDTGPVPGEIPWERTPFRLDPYGRLLPELRRFPSAAHEAGFKPLADFVHNLGLKFGIHIMRGIPRATVEANCPILGSPYRARDIADTNDICPWYEEMFGMNMDHPGAQAYYDSLLALYASWNIDYLKADDMEHPQYQRQHVEALARAIARCGRPIVLSVSTGHHQDTSYAEHRKAHSQLWRIATDLHDGWPQIRETFEFLPRWMPHSGPGHWPDPDMLPLGKVHIRKSPPASQPNPTGFQGEGDPHMTKLSRDEQITTMTLWCISRAPLMFAGDLPSNDEWTLQLIANPETLAVNQRSSGNREVFRLHEVRVWDAMTEDGDSRYMACFNLADDKPASMLIPFMELSLSETCSLRDLWGRNEMGIFTNSVSVTIPPHGARLFKISPCH